MLGANCDRRILFINGHMASRLAPNIGLERSCQLSTVSPQ